MRKVEITNLEDERSHRTVVVNYACDTRTDVVIQPGRSAVVEVPDVGGVQILTSHPLPSEVGSPASDEAADSDGGTADGPNVGNPYAGIGAKIAGRFRGTLD